jgi:hypothetical protein
VGRNSGVENGKPYAWHSIRIRVLSAKSGGIVEPRVPGLGGSVSTDPEFAAAAALVALDYTRRVRVHSPIRWLSGSGLLPGLPFRTTRSTRRSRSRRWLFDSLTVRQFACWTAVSSTVWVPVGWLIVMILFEFQYTDVIPGELCDSMADANMFYDTVIRRWFVVLSVIIREWSQLPLPSKTRFLRSGRPP